jgi:histidine ammonia-lyase
MAILDGEHLTIEEVVGAAGGRGGAVSLAPEAIARMQRSREVVERLTAGDQPVYGVNTGVGLLADVQIPHDQLAQLQRNVVRSHACGVGDPLGRLEVRAMMLIRANVLAKGYSGIRPAVAERLCDMLNRGVTPVVPSKGSVGASGDLAPLAHMALVLIGEGWRGHASEGAGRAIHSYRGLRLMENRIINSADVEGSGRKTVHSNLS